MGYAEFIQQAPYLGSFAVLFAETGFLFGVVVPGGDSLLLALGGLVAAGRLELLPTLTATYAGAFFGQVLGFFWGRRLGPALERRVRPEHLERARRFVRRFGVGAVLLAPFVPVARTLVPFLMGAAGVLWGRYVLLVALASLAWSVGLVLVGYALAEGVLRLVS